MPSTEGDCVRCPGMHNAVLLNHHNSHYLAPCTLIKRPSRDVRRVRCVHSSTKSHRPAARDPGSVRSIIVVQFKATARAPRRSLSPSPRSPPPSPPCPSWRPRCRLTCASSTCACGGLPPCAPRRGSCVSSARRSRTVSARPDEVDQPPIDVVSRRRRPTNVEQLVRLEERPTSSRRSRRSPWPRPTPRAVHARPGKRRTRRPGSGQAQASCCCRPSSASSWRA